MSNNYLRKIEVMSLKELIKERFDKEAIISRCIERIKKLELKIESCEDSIRVDTSIIKQIIKDEIALKKKMLIFIERDNKEVMDKLYNEYYRLQCTQHYENSINEESAELDIKEKELKMENANLKQHNCDFAIVENVIRATLLIHADKVKLEDKLEENQSRCILQ